MPRGRPKGIPKTGGRKKGTPNKATVARAEALREAGIEPKQFLLNGLKFYQDRIAEEERKGPRADKTKIAADYAAGKEFAKDVAPYCHARLAAVEHMGKGGGPIEYSDARDRLAHLIAGQAAADDAGGDTPTTH